MMESHPATEHHMKPMSPFKLYLVLSAAVATGVGFAGVVDLVAQVFLSLVRALLF